MDRAATSEVSRSDAVTTEAELIALRARVIALEEQLQARGMAGAASGDADELEATRALLELTGQPFFQSLLQYLCTALAADCAFVAEMIDQQPGRVRTLAMQFDGERAEPMEYDLRDTPCERLWTSGICMFDCGVQELFPGDDLLRQLRIESYAGTPLYASDRRVLGILVVLRRTPGANRERTEVLLRSFAARAAAELDRLQAETRLRHSETLLRSILDHSTSAIYVKDAQGRYLLVNREFEQAVATTSAEALGRTAAELLPPAAAEQITDHEREVLTRRVPVRREVTLALPGRGECRYILDKVPLFDGDGEVFGTCTMATDITEIKRLEAQLVRTQRLESIGHLAGGVAHDFNNLLTAICGYTSMALDSLAADHPARRELGEALKAGDRAAVLTRQLLAFGRKQVIQPRDVDLVALVYELRGLLRPVLGDRIRLNIRLAPALWPVLADPGQLEQVLMNLSINARDAMPAGGAIQIAAANVTLASDRGADGRLLPAGDYVEIRVRDDGHGIPEAIRPHVFEPFFTTKDGGKGTGLGLATCHGIVVQSGGHIEFESVDSEGSTFIVLLPRGKGAPATPARATEPEPSSGQETVLVVEDEALVRELAVRSLSQAGFRVLEAADGAAALACAAGWAEGIDLLLTDVMMPGMNGLELAARLREVRPGTRVLLMSGYPEAAMTRQQPEHGDWPLLSKPYTPRELSARVRQALDAVTA